MGSLSPLELLDLYWSANHADLSEVEDLKSLATELIHEAQ
jgi:hypothetical protein